MTKILKYREYEEEVFYWLMSKHEKDSKFTFSLRQNGSKGAELDYFIGTSKSNYFGTTFWTLPVSFPGSSGDCIDLIIKISNSGFSYYVEFTQTKDPHDEQNKLALQFIQSLEKDLETLVGVKFISGDEHKMYTIKTKPIQNKYVNLKEMLSDVERQIDSILDLVDRKLVEFKKAHPSYIMHRITLDEFNSMLERKDKRFLKYEDVNSDMNFEEETKSKVIEEAFKTASHKSPLNQILYGPPGTGKTYNSINKAIEIINPNFDLTQDRETVKKEFDRLVTEGQIVFTTFHQSMAYEDFIEGIKPIIDEGEDENKQVLYNVEDGLFKQLVKRAKEQKKETIETSNLDNFDESWEQLIELIRLKISNDELLKIGSWEYGLSNKDSLKYSSLNSPSKYTFTITKQNILDVYQNKKARPSGAFQKDMQDIVDFMKNKFQLKDFKEKNSEEIVVENNQKYVLIIDEINRGNISQIFGELITLIEESKRLGEVEALEVTLTYSKKKFGVPSNVYIIGTMNTADRSVEALDTALRRRFSFEEMLPSYDINELDYFISDYKASEILKTINTRIELLLGREYVIGHSYFLDKTTKELNDIKNAIEGVKFLLDSVNSRVEKDEIKIELTKLNNLLSEKETNRKRYDEINLLESFYKNIIPLLQEYFYNDFGKIGLVLGKGFVRAKGLENKSKSIFADFESRNEVDLIKTYEVVPKSEIKFNEAINLMMV